MIVSAVSLFKKFNTTSPLCASEWGIEKERGEYSSHVSYFGHAAGESRVRIYARFAKPMSEGKKPAVLLLHDVGEPCDMQLISYFTSKGYAVLFPDYSGELKEGEKREHCTVYPPELAHGNYSKAKGLYDMQGLTAEESTWFEWAYVAHYSIAYLKQREDISSIGVVGVRTGGALAWQVMLSPDIACGVPINAIGWQSLSTAAKFGDNPVRNLSDDTHRYIAAVEAQSYAPYVKCPVMMLCAVHDKNCDVDRAYDTYARIGNPDGNALLYSSDCGSCIGPNALQNMLMFLERNLKGREIYIPDSLNVSVQETENGLDVTVDCDKEGLLERVGVFYAEADLSTKCAFRDWRRLPTKKGNLIKDAQAHFTIKPFAGAKAVFVYAYAKYINGFRTMSKITAKRISNPDATAIKGRMLFSGKETDCFAVADYHEYAIGNIFLEREAVVKIVEGYGGIKGAFSVRGIRTYKISSPMYIPDENAMLAFDVYCPKKGAVKITVEVGDMNQSFARYVSWIDVEGGGKWKRNVLQASDFKSELNNMPLEKFADGRALVFAGETDEVEFAVTNILWL